MSFVKVASTSQIPEGKMIPVEAGGKKLLLAHVGGEFRALSRKCTHLGANLCKGKIEGNAVTCPLHGAQFDLTTGAPQRDAKLLFLKMKVKPLESIAVKVEGGDVMVAVS